MSIGRILTFFIGDDGLDTAAAHVAGTTALRLRGEVVVARALPSVRTENATKPLRRMGLQFRVIELGEPSLDGLRALSEAEGPDYLVISAAAVHLAPSVQEAVEFTVALGVPIIVVPPVAPDLEDEVVDHTERARPLDSRRSPDGAGEPR